MSKQKSRANLWKEREREKKKEQNGDNSDIHEGIYFLASTLTTLEPFFSRMIKVKLD